MSEFSESYHMRSTRTEDAVRLLHDLGLSGFVYPAGSGWVTFVADGGNFEPDQRIISAVQQPILHFVSAEDHGWSFTLFDHGNAVCAYSCDWNDDVNFEDSQYSRSALQKYIPAAKAAALDEFEQQMYPSSFEEVCEVEASTLFAKAVGLENYSWVAHDYIARDYHESPDQFRHILKIE